MTWSLLHGVLVDHLLSWRYETYVGLNLLQGERDVLWLDQLFNLEHSDILSSFLKVT